MDRNSRPGRPGSILVSAAVVLGLLIESLTMQSVPSALAQEAQPSTPPAVTGQYVPGEMIAVVAVHPRAFFSQRSMRWLPLEKVRATGEHQVGIDPLQIEQIKLVGKVTPEGPQFGAVVQMAQAIEIASLNADLIRTGNGVTIEGREFYPIDGSSGMVFHRLDDRTVMVGTQTCLQQMLAATGNEMPLTPLLEQLPIGDHLSMVMAMDPVREWLQPILDRQLQSQTVLVPQSLLALRELPALIDHVRLRANLNDRLALKLSLVAVDGQSAERMETILNAAIKDVEQAVVQQLDQGGKWETQEAMRAYMQRISGEFAEVLTPVRQGTELTIQVNELIAAFAITALMERFSLPTIEEARTANRREQNRRNLRQLGLAIHNHESAYNRIPSSVIVDPNSGEKRSWRIDVLPFMKEMELWREYRRDQPWDSEHNLKLIEKMPALFRHPESKAPPGHTVYQMVHGEEIGFRTQESMTFNEVTDGLSNTLMFVEVEDKFAVPWTKPEDVEIDPDNPWPPLGGHNQEGVFAVFFDGSIRVIPYWLEPEALWQMMTRADGKVVIDF